MESKAWVILTDEEKSALSLSINHGKSTWQAGEILGKAHYKYLEIQARAKAFFEMFTLYFNEYGDRLIPEDSTLSWDFQEFIICSIEERMGYRETLKKIGKKSDLANKKSEIRVKTLVDYMEDLRVYPDKQHAALYDIIKEFDRWNNFRILPECLQEPSAFKRRNKTRLVKHLNNIKNLDQFLIDRLTTKFKPGEKYKGEIVYLPIVNDNNFKGYDVVPIKAEPGILKHISKDLHLYLFSDKEVADDYAFLVNSYLSDDNRTCAKGQKFWPRFRILISKSTNFNEVNNIIPRRSNLESAFKDLDKIRVKKANKLHESKLIEDMKPAIRVKAENLWKI